MFLISCCQESRESHREGPSLRLSLGSKKQREGFVSTPRPGCKGKQVLGTSGRDRETPRPVAVPGDSGFPRPLRTPPHRTPVHMQVLCPLRTWAGRDRETPRPVAVPGERLWLPQSPENPPSQNPGAHAGAVPLENLGRVLLPAAETYETEMAQEAPAPATKKDLAMELC